MFNFLQSAFWISITKGVFFLSANVMVSCDVLTRWAQMNVMGFVCVHCNWRNKFQIQFSERRVFLRLTAFSFRLVSKFFMTYWYEVLTHRRSLLSSRTSAAFLFWFLLWFACILVFSFELCVDVALLELTFGCFDCFVRRLFSLLCLPLSSCCLFLPAEVPVPKLKFHD